MKHLNSIQTWMQDALIHSGNKTEPNTITQHVKPSATLTPAKRLAIYQRSYYARLLECLRQQYKALCHALGTELFNDFALEYLKKHPSSSPTLSHLGAKFPSFLEETRPDKDEDQKEEWIDFMVDLASFEWELYQLFDAEGEEGSIIKGSNNNEGVYFFQKCFSLTRYQFPVNDFYREVANGNDPQIPGKEKTFVALCRKDFKIGIFRLLPLQYFMIQKLLEGQSLKIALNLSSARFNLSNLKMQALWNEWKEEWITNGFFK